MSRALGPHDNTYSAEHGQHAPVDAPVDDYPLVAMELQRSDTPGGSWLRRFCTRRNREVALFVLCLVGILNSLDRNIIGVLVEPIKAELHASDTMMGLLSGMSFALFYATLGIPLARWADRGDRTVVITLSLIVWSLMTSLCGLAGSFWQLTAARFGVGAGEAGSIPAAQSLIADYYPPAKRARAIGIFTSSQSVGYAIGLALGGFVAQSYGWRAAFISVGLVGFLFAPLTRFALREPRRSSHLARERASGKSMSHESIGDESILVALTTLLRKPAYRNILGAIVTYYLMAYGAMAFVVSLMIRVHGESVARAGAAFGVVTTLGVALGGILGGGLADRLAARNIARLAVFPAWGLLGAMPFYEVALWSRSFPAMLVLLSLATTLLAAVVPAMFSALHMVCGSRRRAFSVAAAFLFVNLLGIGLGPTLSGFLSDRLAATYGAGEGLRDALMIVTAVLVPASYLMLRAARHLETDAED